MDLQLIHLQSLTSHFHMLSKHIKNVSFSKWWTSCARVKLGKMVMQNPHALALKGFHFFLSPLASRVWPKMAASSNAILLIASYRLLFGFLNSELKLEHLIRWEQAFKWPSAGCRARCCVSAAVQLCCRFVIRNRTLPDCVIDRRLKTPEINPFS